MLKNMLLRIYYVCFLIICGLDLASGVCFDKDPNSVCEFRCRCKNDADCDYNDGSCSSGCDPKWMGPSCQYGNLAYNKGVKGTVISGVLTDGDKSTCLPLNTYNNPTIYIDFEQTFTIERLLIYNKNYDSNAIQQLKVYIGDDTPLVPNENNLCFQADADVREEVLDVKCIKALDGRYITLKSLGKNIPMPICEIEIYGGADGAYGQPTELYSTWDPTNPGKFQSHLAVNGILTGLLEFVHTRGGLPDEYWFVNIEKQRRITRVRLYYRDHYYDRLNGFDLIIRNQGKEVFRTVISGTGRFTDIPLIPPHDGDNVTIYHPNRGEPINVVEVEVYFSCPDGRFSFQYKKCNCYSQTEVCDKIHGSCVSGCKLGFNGTDCLSVCPDGTFGWQCNFNCNCEYPKDVCEKANGHCRNGCKRGFQGEKCKDECEAKTFGLNCAFYCNCLDSTETCDNVDGHCKSGCKAGYEGPGCQQECNEKRFGVNCKFNCNCYDSTEICDKGSGQCSTGCKVGYEGLGCQDICSGKTFGRNCENTCHCFDANEVCNNTNGVCVSGCESGFKGHNCQEECSDKSFGAKCIYNCNCYDSMEICDKGSGRCSSGCKVGYEGPGCQNVCSGKTFGRNCENTCHCFDANEICNNVYGFCISGCKSGFKGHNCQEGGDTEYNFIVPIVVVSILVVGLVVGQIVLSIVIWRLRKQLSELARRDLYAHIKAMPATEQPVTYNTIDYTVSPGATGRGATTEQLYENPEFIQGHSKRQ